MPTEYAGAWETKDFTNVRQENATMSTANTAIGADITPAQRPLIRRGPRMDCTTPTTKTTSAMASTTVFASMPLSWTVRSHHGTAKEETYHHAFQPASVSAMRNSTAASAKVRLRSDFSAIRESTTAPTAAIAPPMPA